MRVITASITAIAVYGRIIEMGHAAAFAVICGAVMGAMVYGALRQIKKTAGAGTPNGR